MKKIDENCFQISPNLFIKNYNNNQENLNIYNPFFSDDIFYIIFNNDLYQLNVKEEKFEFEKIQNINTSNINPKEISFTKKNIFILDSKSISFFSEYNFLNNKFNITRLNPIPGILEKKKIKKI